MNPIIEEVESIARRVCQDILRQAAPTTVLQGLDDSSQALKQMLCKIMAKEFISIKETALLLGCSDSHVRNLVDKAKKGKAVSPIPYRDLDGVTTFHREELLEWTKARKSRSKSPRQGNTKTGRREDC